MINLKKNHPKIEKKHNKTKKFIKFYFIKLFTIKKIQKKKKPYKNIFLCQKVFYFKKPIKKSFNTYHL